MEENIYIQIYIFLFTLYGGLIIGILYDMIDILLGNRNKKNKGRWKKDILFWLLAIMIVLEILFYSSDGIIRTYTLFGFIVGWILYFWLLSGFIRKVIIFMITSILNISKGILTLFFIPFKWIKSILYTPVMKMQDKTNQLKDRLIKYFKIPKLIIAQFKKYKKYLTKSQK
ncbi:spore cortex biosynthesis protein YabQ [Garciella nitratireducens]|uniref:Spore cortex biosynthesis protein YabQ n=1 Tax=Garciella nitratireducens DSM 15102 TaxID=1121911 RepID=A0A1T4L5F0_9FIRM|nr:spore cortex biosynthesis protein YabQ [Garciella nitratireducens]RBP35476.1 spore cortex biosynthesis protein YabQ [Garciella nitratireducens]SJZ49868.1 spore cortex biosynthesis protein YabQ [Garciella nitratireducens DSM 15102]